jgi:hypothetical protein
MGGLAKITFTILLDRRKQRLLILDENDLPETRKLDIWLLTGRTLWFGRDGKDVWHGA